MPPPGRRALKPMDENTQSGLDTWAAKALDGLALTPAPAVQQEVSQDPFTGSRKDAESPTRQAAQAGLYLSSPLNNALNPTHSKEYDAELRRAWLRLDKQTRWELTNHCNGAVASVDKFAHLRSYIMSSASMPRTIAEEAPLEDAADAALDDDLLRETDAASELSSEDIVYTGAVTEMGTSWLRKRDTGNRCSRGGCVRVDQTGNNVYVSKSFAGASGGRIFLCVGDRIEFRIHNQLAVDVRRLEASPLAPTCLPALAASRTAAAPLDDDLLREIAFDDGQRPRRKNACHKINLPLRLNESTDFFPSFSNTYHHLALQSKRRKGPV